MTLAFVNPNTSSPDEGQGYPARYNGDMKRRKLRIAWSVWWCIIATLLTVLWVRSYWRTDAIYIGWRGVPYNVTIGSDHGRAGFSLRDYDITPGTGANPLYWWHDESPIESDSLIVEPDPDGGIPGRRWFRIVHPDAQHDLGLLLPLWLLPFIALAIAAMPFVRWSNRFSLRTLLIATTLIAVGLGVIAWLL